MDLLPADPRAAAARLWAGLDEARLTAMDVGEALGYLWPRLPSAGSRGP